MPNAFSSPIRIKKNNFSQNPRSKEWDYEKNFPFKPENFSIKSDKKVWFKCEKGHSYQRVIREQKKECPVCIHESKSQFLQHLIDEFSNKNEKSINNFTLGSNQKVWWQCSKHTEHEWQATIKNRVNGTGCPYCSGCLPSKQNNLSLHPVSKEFHYERNTPFKPEDFTLNSGKKIWWKCSLNSNHEWEMRISDRTRDWECGCPHCGLCGTSKAEQEIFEYISTLADNVLHRSKIDGIEVDIYIPSKKVAIEFNGLYWHSEKFRGEDYHFVKYDCLNNLGVNLLYIWEDEWRDEREKTKKKILRFINGDIVNDGYKKSHEWTDGRFRYPGYKRGLYKIWGSNSFRMKNE